MTESEVLHILNILVLLLFVGYQSAMIKTMKYSLYYCLVNKWFRQKTEPFKWLMENRHYIWMHITIPCVLSVTVIMISQLNIGIEQIRPVYMLYFSIILWLAVIKQIQSIHSKIKS